LSTIINGTSSAITFPDTTVQNTAFTTGAVTQSTIATGVAGTGPAFAAYITSTQTISTNTWTRVAMAGEFFDTNGCFNNTSGTVTLNGLSVPSYSFCPNVAGYYQFSLSGDAGGSSDQTVVSIERNANEIYTSGWGNKLTASVSGVLYLNGTGDYVSAYIYSSGTSVLNAPQLNFITGCMVRAA